MDAYYISKSGDSAYQSGQRLIIKSAAVLEFVDLVDKLGKELLARARPKIAPPAGDVSTAELAERLQPQIHKSTNLRRITTTSTYP
ncbi:hypothetical protein [Ensifer sp. NM-2]|uniref:hypothetical protein n=1 Tax=Ensifer sp. NM-2 TaxID=2109730 RepID=UPI001FDEB4B0|nr:hypothetical protein [Ensifer sp. NM-2]